MVAAASDLAFHCTCTPRGETVAIQEHLNGKVVEWMEKVTDEQYAGTASR